MSDHEAWGSSLSLPTPTSPDPGVTGKIPAMKPSLQKLQKFFRLEAERGYDNRAVVGGFERMLGPWEAEARLDELPEELISAVITRLRDYHQLSPSSRQETLQGLWQRIQRDTSPQGEVDIQTEQITTSGDSFASSEDESPSIEVDLEVEVEAETLPAPNHSPLAPRTVSRTRLSARPVSITSLDALAASVTVLPGVGSSHGQTLRRLGVETLGDMLYYFPRRYDDYSQLKPINRLEYGEQVTVIAEVRYVTTRKVRNGQLTITEVIVEDGTGTLRLSWFNQPWATKRLRTGVQIAISGKIDQYLGRLTINNPEIEQIEQTNLHTNRIVPVYPLSANITQRWLRRLMHQVVSYWAPRLEDPLPDTLRQSEGLLALSEALLQVHFPDNKERLAAARQRLAFDEILFLQLGMLSQKRVWQARAARSFEVAEDWLEAQLSRLPYSLTAAQKRALEDIRSDLASGRPMNRLLQGDVGSGKTVIAALGIAIVTSRGAQAAMMAPTSILAEQHYATLKTLLANQGASTSLSASGILDESQIRLLIRATPEAERRAILSGLASGEIKVLVGTHALIEDPVVFADLQLAVVDEQHRFGVAQRASLRAKGENPHLLVMTATPIPRSLALTVYGDLDLTVMDEMPPHRQIVSTHILYPRERERAYNLIRNQVAQGYQAFIIYPLVEGEGLESSEYGSGESKAAVEEHRRLQAEVFPSLRLALLHGRMRPDEKEAVMSRFRAGEYDILVSTSVVEVGVDIPNATVMLIEGANRFGLSQLHQFRGRVGRGSAKAYCLLIPETQDAAENERLSAMVETNDGFVLAEIDLKQRGPGDFLGVRQSGFFSQLRLAKLTDVQLIERAQHAARKIIESDPELTAPNHRKLAAALQAFWGQEHPNMQADIS